MSDSIATIKNLQMPEFELPDSVPAEWTLSDSKAIHIKLSDPIFYRLQDLVHHSDYKISKTGLVSLLLARLFAALDKEEHLMSTKLPKVITPIPLEDKVSDIHQENLSGREKAKAVRYHMAKAEALRQKKQPKTEPHRYQKGDEWIYVDANGNEMSEDQACKMVKDYLISEGMTPLDD